jgi:nucleotide-binding universal stress UspA family protein
MNSTPGTIVVGVDGSESSTRALRWAAEQGREEHRPLTLLHSIHIETATYTDAALVYPQEVREELRAEGHRTLASARAEVEKTAPGLEVHEVFRFDDPRAVLLELSRDAAMVVLGSRGRGKVRSLLLGSVGVALARHAHCPVVVHRPGNPGTVRNGILVGADGTEESRSVLEFAYREASLRNLPLTVLHCFWDRLATYSAAYIVPESPGDRETERLHLGETMIGFSEKYPEVVAHIETIHGLPQEALVTQGERMNLVVVGAHQAGAVSQMLLGAVSVAVVEHATCPVAVVPISTPQ